MTQQLGHADRRSLLVVGPEEATGDVDLSLNALLTAVRELPVLYLRSLVFAGHGQTLHLIDDAVRRNLRDAKDKYRRMVQTSAYIHVVDK